MSRSAAVSNSPSLILSLVRFWELVSIMFIVGRMGQALLLVERMGRARSPPGLANFLGR